MKISEKRELYIKQIEAHFIDLDKSLDALFYSYKKCESIEEKKECSLDELEIFEALSARFARSSDILTQKVIKSLVLLLQENMNTIIDTANFLEKLEIIENAHDLINIRELRNQIAHDYVAADLNALYDDVLAYTPKLKAITKNLKNYYNKTFL